MSAATSEKTTAARELLQRACERNLSAEVHFDRSGKLCAARMRLLWLRDDELRTDSPQSIGKDVALRPKEAVTVFFTLDETQYGFQTDVLKPILEVDLNSRKRVVGASLRVPQEIQEQQRRHDFRLSLANHNVMAILHETDPADVTCCAIDAEPFKARITNLSVGGLGLLVEVKERRKFTPCERLFIQFSLPEEHEPFICLAEVRHFRTIHDGNAIVVGVQFNEIPGSHDRSLVHRLRAFVTAEQRRQIQQRR